MLENSGILDIRSYNDKQSTLYNDIVVQMQIAFDRR